MGLAQNVYRTYVRILEEELVPAFGCTEPIAIAYCAAKAREVLGTVPEKSGYSGQWKYHQECKKRNRTEHRRPQRDTGSGSGGYCRRTGREKTGSDLGTE